LLLGTKNFACPNQVGVILAMTSNAKNLKEQKSQENQPINVFE
jgi:hypothetical protein